VSDRYYAIDLNANPQTKASRIQAFLDRSRPGPTRQWAYQIGHYVISRSGMRMIAQANTSDDEHAQLIGLSYVTYLGDYDPVTGFASPAVYAYKAQNPSEWETPS